MKHPTASVTGIFTYATTSGGAFKMIIHPTHFAKKNACHHLKGINYYVESP